MYSPVLSIPARRVSGWVAETDPRYARAWLASLPLANSAESAREIYQALYTVNRIELRVQTRMELLDLYEPVVASTCSALASYLMNAAPPLGAKKRQLAEFIRRLHIEMGYGYKCCLRDLSHTRLMFGKRARFARCIERALFHSSEVLLRSYVVYIPCTESAWRETHELYRLAESLGLTGDALKVDSESVVRSVTVGERYVQTLLLGLANPYQLPQNGAQQVHAFLTRWGGKAHVVPVTPASDVSGLFLIDLVADAAPVPFGGDATESNESRRLLDVRELLQTLRAFVSRLDNGESIEKLSLGVDVLDSTCSELLHRMLRSWGDTARRRYARRQQSSNVFVCSGMNALRFFVNGQRPFTPYLPTPNTAGMSALAVGVADVAFVELDDAAQAAFDLDNEPSEVKPASLVTESYRVDRWQLRDIGPQGMSLARYGDAATPMRVGDLIGVQQPSDLGRWRAAVIRWVKSPETDSLEMGLEVLAASVAPVAVRPATGQNAVTWRGALRLPASDVACRPATLLVARGTSNVGDELDLFDEQEEPRRVRVLRLLERTGSFEQIVYADIARH